MVKVVVFLPLPLRRCGRWYPRRVASISTGAWPATVMGIVLIGLLVAPLSTQAQEATPPPAGTPSASTPVAADAECALPLPADAPISDGTGGSRLLPVASPSPTASPIASPAASGSVGDAGLAEALGDTAAVIATCLSEG
ncbi:MAG: hypothetical protein M3121_04345, partial [Chloroflexota bacterium]|nr:hypothetical protein [Chloroflexota bacterium]